MGINASASVYKCQTKKSPVKHNYIGQLNNTV